MGTAAHDLQGRLARFIKEVAPLFTAEKPVSFDPVQMTFLQSLVREGVLKGGFSIAKEHFFKGMVFVDYFTEVVAGRPTLLEDLAVIVEELEKMHEYLDMDLTLLVRYTGLYIIKDLKGDRFFSPSSLAAMAKRHERTNTTVPPAPVTGASAEADIFHQAVARMVLDLIATAEVRDPLVGFQGRNDLKAAMVCDSILGSLPRPVLSESAYEALALAEYGRAAGLLFADLTKASVGWSLKGHVEQLRGTLHDEP
jgi:hypothetical protein